MEIKWILKTPEVHQISSQQNYYYFNFQLMFWVNEAVWGLFAYFHSGEVLTTHLTEEQTHSAVPLEHMFSGDDGQQLQNAEGHQCSEAAWLRISSICIISGHILWSQKQQKQKTKKGFLRFFPLPNYLWYFLGLKRVFKCWQLEGTARGNWWGYPLGNTDTDLIASGFLFCFNRSVITKYARICAHSP